jgi:hypothetical protein
MERFNENNILASVEDLVYFQPQIEKLGNFCKNFISNSIFDNFQLFQSQNHFLNKETSRGDCSDYALLLKNKLGTSNIARVDKLGFLTLNQQDFLKYQHIASLSYLKNSKTTLPVLLEPSLFISNPIPIIPGLKITTDNNFDITILNSDINGFSMVMENKTKNSFSQRDFSYQSISNYEVRRFKEKMKYIPRNVQLVKYKAQVTFFQFVCNSQIFKTNILGEYKEFDSKNVLQITDQMEAEFEILNFKNFIEDFLDTYNNCQKQFVY